MRSKLFIAAVVALAISVVAAIPARAQGSQYYFPQVADGTYTGGFYSTSFTISNVFQIDNPVTLRFTRSTGAAWTIDLRSTDRPEITGRKSSVTFTLKSRESVLVYTGGVDPLAVGWGMIESDFPVVASEFFGVLKGSPSSYLNAEAGVLASPPVTQLSFFADVTRNEPVVGTDVDTGFAVANPSAAAAQITATLFSRTGASLGDRQISLGPGAHTAQFVSELFRTANLPAAFHGRIRFNSNVNIAVVALRQTFGRSDTISTVSVVPDIGTGTTTVYDREPNDTLATAQQLVALPAEIIGTMNTPADGGDVDVFSLSLRAGDILYVFVLADMINSTLDDSIIIWDSQGRQVAQADTFSDGLLDPFLRYQVPANGAGVYFIDHGSVRQSSSRGAYYKMYVLVK